MPGHVSRLGAPEASSAVPRASATTDPPWVRRLLVGTAVAFLGLLLVAPLVLVFTQALSKGIEAYGAALVEPEAMAAIKLTLLVAAIAVPLNTLFGLAASWAIGKFRFRG